MFLIKNIFKTLTKCVSIPLGFTAAASTAHAGIHKNLELEMATLIISNEEMDDIMKIIKSLEESGLLMKGKTIENRAKRTKRWFS